MKSATQQAIGKEVTNRENRPQDHCKISLVDWTIHVDERLYEEPNIELGERYRKFLEAKLRDITRVAPEDKLEHSRKIHFYLQLELDGETLMVYHPSRTWLERNDYPTEMAGSIQIPKAQRLPTRHNTNEQAWVMLHDRNQSEGTASNAIPPCLSIISDYNARFPLP